MFSTKEFITHYTESISELQSVISVNVNYENTDHIPADDVVSMYFRQMVSEPLLSPEQEVALARIIDFGRQAEELLECEPELTQKEQNILEQAVADGQQARQQFIRANTRLVISVAKRYRNQNLPLEDLIQEGNIGLMIAVDKFDYTLGNRFSTYAIWWIRQSITRALNRKSRTIRLPDHISDRVRQVLKCQQTLATQLQREPSWADVAEHLDMTEEEVLDLVNYNADIVDLDAPVNESDDDSLADIIADPILVSFEEVIEDSFLRDIISRVIAEELPPRQAEVIRLRFGLNGVPAQSLNQIAKVMNLSRESVRTIQNNALRYMRHPRFAQKLAPFMVATNIIS